MQEDIKQIYTTIYNLENGTKIQVGNDTGHSSRNHKADLKKKQELMNQYFEQLHQEGQNILLVDVDSGTNIDKLLDLFAENGFNYVPEEDEIEEDNIELNTNILLSMLK